MRNSATPLDFSKAQIKHLMKRNDLTQKLFAVTDDISKANISIPVRIASERNKQYVLIKNEATAGGGWVLGVRDPAPSGSAKDRPVQIDTTDSDTAGGTDEGEFEAVSIPEGCVVCRLRSLQLIALVGLEKSRLTLTSERQRRFVPFSSDTHPRAR